MGEYTNHNPELSLSIGAMFVIYPVKKFFQVISGKIFMTAVSGCAGFHCHFTASLSVLKMVHPPVVFYERAVVLFVKRAIL